MITIIVGVLNNHVTATLPHRVLPTVRSAYAYLSSLFVTERNSFHNFKTAEPLYDANSIFFNKGQATKKEGIDTDNIFSIIITSSVSYSWNNKHKVFCHDYIVRASILRSASWKPSKRIM